ncbi:hypothetical protein NP233_g4092 [Leucocoprinus birnbaumii]|uniref:F-box domain-containing protein n=1 Tax=Leucocoprinus birnbaumii TaxID=56174 RepID=A0AAD5VWR6_9AGAR|nr:hypothetical protein NP233_g4092 [Leucocoprinus birnbaumii]
MPILPPASKSLLRDTQRPISGDSPITRLRQEKESRLKEISASVSHLQKLQNSLSLERQGLMNYIAKTESIVSQFNHLPLEIVEEIFYHCLPIAHNAVTSIHEPPLLLGRVCKTWRHVAYSTPRLWTTLHIVVIVSDPPTYHKERDAKVDGISAWISRSGVLPLSISVYRDNLPSPWLDPPFEHQFQPYFDAIFTQSHRWKSLYFMLRDVNWTDILSRIRSSDVPSLEELRVLDHVKSASWMVSSRDMEAVSTFSRGDGILCAPRLRSLALPHYIAHILGRDMRWDRLTSLDITYHSVPFLADFARIAAQCGSLSHLTMAFTPVSSSYQGLDTWPSSFTSQTDPLSPPSPITLPSLQSLSIRGRPGYDDAVCETFIRLSTPALRHLTWQRPSADPLNVPIKSTMVQILQVFIARLVNPLEELHLILDLVRKSVLIGILSLVPRLKRLSLAGEFPPVSLYSPSFSFTQSSRFFNDHLLQEFMLSTLAKRSDNTTSIDTESSEGPKMPLCPDLEVVHFLGVEFTPESVAMFLRSRAATNLRKLSIVFMSNRRVRLHEEHRDGIPELERLARDIWCSAFIFRIR